MNDNYSSSISLNASYSSEIESKIKVNLVEKEGYFLIGKSSLDCSTFILTITIAFARNLIRVNIVIKMNI
jgi:hypothetical protein